MSPGSSRPPSSHSCCGIGQYPSSWCTQFCLLFERSFQQVIRNRVLLVIRLVLSVFFGVLMGLIASGSGGGQRSIQDKSGVLFFTCINQAFGGMFGTLNSFPREKNIVMRERAAKSYYSSSYYLAKVCAELPVSAFFPMVYAIVVYWMAGLNPDPLRFANFIGITMLISLVSMGFGVFVAAGTNSVDAATQVGPQLLIVFLLFGGFYINTQSIPVWLAWIQEFSLLRWGFEALSVNEFRDLAIGCVSNATASEAGITDATKIDDVCLTGNDALKRLSFGAFSAGQCAAYLGVIGAAFHLLAYLLLRFKKPTFQVLLPSTHSKPRSKPTTISAATVREAGTGGRVERQGAAQQQRRRPQDDPAAASVELAVVIQEPAEVV